MLRKFMVIAATTALFTVGGAFSTTADASPVEKNLSYKVSYSINGETGTFTNEEASNFVEKALQRLQAKFQHVNIEQLKQSIPAKEQVVAKEEPKKETNAPAKEQPVEKKEKVQEPAAEKQVEETPQAPVEQPQVQQEPQAQQEQHEEQIQTELSEFEVQVVEKTNEERAKHGLQALQIDEELSKVARDKSKDMAVNGYFDHNSPVYGSPFDMMGSYGIDYRTAGENIAKGQRSPQEVVDAWMNSPGHRANILNGDFTHIGVGFVEQGNHWTQMFIGK